LSDPNSSRPTRTTGVRTKKREKEKKETISLGIVRAGLLLRTKRRRYVPAQSVDNGWH
jgi:hypothetical protein